MATQKTAWDYLGDMFDTMATQDTMKAQAATNAMASGATYFQKKDYTRASNEFKRAISLDPTNAQSYNYLANAYLAQKKYDEAIKTYKTSLSIDPTQDSVHTNLGNIYLQQKKYNLAETEFKQAAKLNPTDTLAPYTLGQLYLQTGRYSEAETQFKKVERMAPTDPNPYYSLGATYNKEGKYQDAVKQLTQAIKIRPKMEAAHFELGVAYAALGDSTNAQKEVDTLTRLNKAQGQLLKRTIAQPKMMAGGGGANDNFFWQLADDKGDLDTGDLFYKLYKMDVATFGSKDSIVPNASKQFMLTFYFDSDMDAESVMDTNNWTIRRASGGAAGYYDNMMYPVSDVSIPQNPTSVSYNADERSATITFMLSQNSTGDATIDPSRMIFKFSGKDVTGKVMDPTADEFAGTVGSPF